MAAFLLYKSTQTGKQTKSGQSKGPFSSPVFYFYALIIIVAGGFALYNFNKADHLKSEIAVKESGSTHAQAGPVPVQGGAGVPGHVGPGSTHQVSSVQPVFVNPYNAKAVYVTGSALDSQGNGVVTFSLYGKDGTEYHTNNDELLSMGYAVQFRRYCQAELFNIETGQSVTVHCEPSKYEEPKASGLPTPALLNPFTTTDKASEGGEEEGAA